MYKQRLVLKVETNEKVRGSGRWYRVVYYLSRCKGFLKFKGTVQLRPFTIFVKLYANSFDTSVNATSRIKQ